MSPIFFPDYSNVFEEVDKSGIIELVVTEDIFKVLLNFSEKCRNLKLFVIDVNPKIAFAVTTSISTSASFIVLVATILQGV
ncbi:hypothetical protein DRP04_13280 [Archaeoglobales archaeon]|nr:MAG: hypothetical protein DRP04_13280 [Archaeoglobales archaeon]